MTKYIQVKKNMFKQLNWRYFYNEQEFLSAIANLSDLEITKIATNQDN